MPVLLSYRNQSIDLHGKSIDCFLYEGNIGTKWVKYIKQQLSNIWSLTHRKVKTEAKLKKSVAYEKSV